MNSGDLRDRVTFFRPTATTDALRGQAVTYTQILTTVWCQWRGLTGREWLQAQAMTVIPQHRITIRYRSDITTKLRAQRQTAQHGVSGPMCEVVAVNDQAGTMEWLDVDLAEVL